MYSKRKFKGGKKGTLRKRPRKLGKGVSRKKSKSIGGNLTGEQINTLIFNFSNLLNIYYDPETKITKIDPLPDLYTKKEIDRVPHNLRTYYNTLKLSGIYDDFLNAYIKDNFISFFFENHKDMDTKKYSTYDKERLPHPILCIPEELISDASLEKASVSFLAASLLQPTTDTDGEKPQVRPGLGPITRSSPLYLRITKAIKSLVKGKQIDQVRDVLTNNYHNSVDEKLVSIVSLIMLEK